MDPFCSCDPETACDCQPTPEPEVHYGAAIFVGPGESGE